MRARAAATAVLLATLARPVGPQEAAPVAVTTPTDWSSRVTLRLLPNDDRSQRTALLRDLAAWSAYESVTVPAGMTLEAFVQARCGFATPDLLDIVKKANPSWDIAPRTPLTAPKEIQIPACPQWQFDKVVTVPAAGAPGVRFAIQDYMGYSGSESLELFRKKNPELDFSDVAAGDKVKMPYITWSVSIHPKDNTPEAATAMVWKFEKKYGDRIVGGKVVVERGIDLEKEITPAEAGTVCTTPPSVGQPWPFDRSEVLEVLKTVPLGKSVVVIADTGMVREDIGRLAVLENRGEADLKENDNKDNDENTFKDDRYGANMDPQGGFPALDAAYARSKHGTHVAGLVLGGPSGDELAQQIKARLGVAIANIVKPIQFAGSPRRWEFTTPAIESSIRYARAVHAQVVNWSFQSPEPMDNVEEKLKDPYLPLFVVSAGNDGAVLGKRSMFPASYGADPSISDHMIIVAAHAPNRQLTTFSNRGQEVVDLAAPGCGLSTMESRQGTTTVAGTSFAAPLVSLTAALLAAGGLDRPSEIKRRLMATVDLDYALGTQVRWGGRLDVAKALAFKHDVLQVAQRPPGAGRLRLGRIEAPREWSICGRKVPLTDIMRVVPNRRAGPMPTWVLLRDFNSAGRLVGVKAEYCSVPTFDIQFRRLGAATSEKVKMADLTDIVPGWR